MLRRFAPEGTALCLLVLAFLFSALREPRFLNAAYLFERSALSTETGLLVLTMTLLIVAGQIDLSCTAILALVGAVVTTLYSQGVPVAVLLPLALLLGALCGAFNGFFVTRLKLPPLVVTLATMALFRGGAQILLGERSLPVPPSLQHIEQVELPGTYFHVPLLLVTVLAAGTAFLLHKTVFGRWITAMGVNAEAARHMGVPVASVTMRLFILSGAMAGLAALTLLSRLGVARFDHAQGLELDVITAVVLGGASIFGGRGTVAGSLIALLLIGVVQTGMGVAGVKAETQVASIGALLLGAVLIANLTRRGARA